MSWFTDIFKKRCPQCRSTDIAERDVLSFTYYLFYVCRSCGYEWKEGGL